MILSIITINYNNAVGLGETIQSVVNQTFSDFEYIVIDGASTDESVDIIKKYSDKINYWISEPDKGIYNAMNKGIYQAEGEYLLFINSGDYLYNEFVLSEIFKLNISGDLVYGDLHRRFPNGETDIVKMPDYAHIGFMMKSTLTHPTTLIKKSLFQKYGVYREDLKIVSDWAFFLKIIAFGDVSQQHIPIIISSFAMDGICSTNQVVVEIERAKVLNDYFSPELVELIHNYEIYRTFYFKEMFLRLRKLKYIFGLLRSPSKWTEYIYRKRKVSFIKLINKTVRQQIKNPLTIPVIIINYNRLNDLKKLVSFLLDRKHTNIIIVDNNSTYPPLLEYYHQIENKKEITIERMNKNYGHMVFWENTDLFNKYAKGYYIVTDSDIIPNQNLPINYLDRMIELLNNHNKISKVGFALQIDDIPNTFQMKAMVLKWEQQYWRNLIEEDVYFAHIDTTFAIYAPMANDKITEKKTFLKGIRIAGSYTAKHMGWYINHDVMNAEETYYYKTSNNSNSWKIGETGDFMGKSEYNEL